MKGDHNDFCGVLKIHFIGQGAFESKTGQSEILILKQKLFQEMLLSSRNYTINFVFFIRIAIRRKSNNNNLYGEGQC